MTGQPDYDCFGRWYAEGPYAAFVREQRTAGEAPVHLTRVAKPAGAYPDPATPDLVLAIAASEFGGSVDLGAGRFATRFRPGSLLLTPPGTACDFAFSQPLKAMFFSFPMAAMRSALEGRPGVPAAALAGDFGPMHARAHRDPTVEHLCLRLWEETEAGNPHGHLFADGAVLALAAALLRLSGQPQRPERHQGGLTPRQLRHVLEAMDAHLAEDVTLARLAAAAGTGSVSHFGQAFRQTVGEPPHRHLMRRRVERAQALLLRGDLPLAHVADACGFADQAHMTHAFRRVLGTTPGQWRRERLG